MPRRTVSIALIVALSASFSLCVYALFAMRNPLGTLEPAYYDHIRHMRYAWELLRRGWEVYLVPAGELEPIGHPLAYDWEHVPYLYPPGALLMYLPFGVLSYGDHVADPAVWKALILLLVGAGHFSVYLFARRLRDTELDNALRVLLVGVYYLHALLWSFNSQYEAVVVILILAAAGSQRPERRALWLAGAMFLKFQALLALPYLIESLGRSRKEGRLLAWPNVAAAVLLLCVAATVLLIRSHLAPEPNNPIRYHTLELDPRAYLTGAVCLASAAYAWRKRSYMVLIAIATIWLALSFVAQLQAWHLMLLFPLVTLHRTRGERELMGLWVLAFLFVLSHLAPDPVYVWSLLQSAIMS